MIRFPIFPLAHAAGAVPLSARADQPATRAGPNIPPPTEVIRSNDPGIGPEPAASPDDVEIGPKPSGGGRGEVAAIRRGALREAAQGYGSGMGYARRGWETWEILERRAAQLNRAFDFSRVVSAAPVKAGFVVPPVVSRGFNAFDGMRRAGRLRSPGSIRPLSRRVGSSRSDRHGAIIFRSSRRRPKNRRGRLCLEPGRDEAVQGMVRRRVGGRRGTRGRGNLVPPRPFAPRLRGHAGIPPPRIPGMMDRMVPRKADFGVTGGGGEMRIGGRTVAIVSDAEFNANPRRWSVVAVSERDGLIVAAGGLPPVHPGVGPNG